MQKNECDNDIISKKKRLCVMAVTADEGQRRDDDVDAMGRPILPAFPQAPRFIASPQILLSLSHPFPALPQSRASFRLSSRYRKQNDQKRRPVMAVTARRMKRVHC
ncbi:hypothetical protein [Magnetospira sp. QH-2]|uniref:hypothetical protein n=1 Tax=Magnetospira sp. (strain QH-2) TaxID=1288970 RepID=UPI0003E8163A|nr:hypothetical protein [Magnetospira sp. QH-2]CCQ73366.1 Protein of unknown function [Magnetospira sp. QH-2]